MKGGRNMMFAKIGLMACPFCGGVPEIERKVYEVLGHPFELYGFTCNDCGAVVSFRGKEAREEAIGAWNTRED